MNGVMALSTVRVPVAAGLSAGVTALLIQVMSSFVQGPSFEPPEEPRDSIEVTFVRTSQAQTIRQMVLPEKHAVVVPSIPKVIGCGEGIDVDIDAEFRSDVRLGPLDPFSVSLSEVPMSRVNPIYPVIAAQKGIEGFVRVRFDITETGRTANVRVLHAQPAGVFEQAALDAVAKWKYMPRRADNCWASTEDLDVRITFRLED